MFFCEGSYMTNYVEQSKIIYNFEELIFILDFSRNEVEKGQQQSNVVNLVFITLSKKVPYYPACAYIGFDDFSVINETIEQAIF